MTVLTIPRPTRFRVRRGAGAATYEVQDDAGRCLYRGHDLGLADEICGSAPGLHLTVLTPALAVGA